MSTIAAREPIVGYPFVNVFSVSDGPVNNSTGVPMLYLTDMEISSADLRVTKVHNNITNTFVTLCINSMISN